MFRRPETSYGRQIKYDGEGGNMTNTDVEHLLTREYRKEFAGLSPGGYAFTVARLAPPLKGSITRLLKFSKLPARVGQVFFREAATTRVVLLPLLILTLLPRSSNASYVRREERIPMRDGVKLYTVIFKPDDRTESLPSYPAADALRCSL